MHAFESGTLGVGEQMERRRGQGCPDRGALPEGQLKDVDQGWAAPTVTVL